MAAGYDAMLTSGRVDAWPRERAASSAWTLFPDAVTVQVVSGIQVFPLWSWVRACRAVMPCLRVVVR
jgi:hypothetical protein